MSGCRGASGIRTVASAAVLGAVLAACTSTPPPPQGTPTTTPVTTATTPSVISTPTPPPPPSYTPPPSRGVKRPPGVAPVTGVPCDPASTDAHFYEAAWYSAYVAYVETGDPVPDSQWASGVQAFPTFLGGSRKARAALQSA